MKIWLIDTAPIVAYLDSTDPYHERVSSRLEEFDGGLASTSAVVTETMHFVAPARSGPQRLAEFISASGAEVYNFCGARELRAAVSLMEQYHDTPMDFADATLLLLAEALRVRDILTLDRRGFSAYRTREHQALRMVLDSKRSVR